MEPEVSVVVPAYNVQSFLGECIESVVKQTFQKWELIIVNDGSTDQTLDIARQFEMTDWRISVVDQPNSGVSAARNAGLYLARGNYIIFLDGDDLWKPQLLEKLVEAAISSGKPIAYCGYNRLYKNGIVRPYRYQYPQGDILIPPKNQKVQLHIGAMLFSRSFLNRYHLQFTVGSLIGEDWEFICKALALADVQSVPLNLMIYRQRPGSALHAGWNWEKQIHALRSFDRAIRFIADQGDAVRNRQKKVEQLKKKLAYKTLRFLWRTFKFHGWNEMKETLESQGLMGYLTKLDVKRLGPVDRLRYHMIISGNRHLWFSSKILK